MYQNQQFTNDERVRLIREFVEEHKLETLFHFTRVENLSSILQMGLLGRSQLVERSIQFEEIDRSRQDRCPEAVCMTISFPNYKLFWAKRKHYWERNGVHHNQWVVLLLEARLLWELDCAFCIYNAAANTVTSIPLEERRKPEALEAMFGDLKTVTRRRLNFPPYYTSSSQAEVLVFDAVPVSYLKEVHFYDQQGWESWFNNNYTASNASFFICNRYFEKRKNY